MNISSINIDKHINAFRPVGLDEMDGLGFLKRSDTKYVFNIAKLGNFLAMLGDQYKVLQINGTRVQEYETIYYDTPGYDMYHMHHNGIRNRYKVRTRQYISSEIFFLEVKKKNNKGITNKKRIAITSLQLEDSNSKHSGFVANRSPFITDGLVPVIRNNFKRLTLVQKDIPERMTIDWDLRYSHPGSDNTRNLDNICIVEVKKEQGSKNHEFDQAIKACRIYPMGFSKYCFGVILFEPSIKSNRFKPRLHNLKKLNITD